MLSGREDRGTLVVRLERLTAHLSAHQSRVSLDAGSVVGLSVPSAEVRVWPSGGG